MSSSIKLSASRLPQPLQGQSSLRAVAARSALPVRLVVNGLGHMGVRGLQAFQSVAQDLHAQGRNVAVRALLDVDRSVPDRLQKLLPVLSPAPEILVRDRAAALDLADLLRGYMDREPALFLVYDASPSRFHFSNLKSVLSASGALYLAEKPIVANAAELLALEHLAAASNAALDARVFCDLVETQSAVSLHLRDLVAAGDLQIDALRFFRLSSSGISKTSHRGERRGVQGGAFIDKAIHDISVTLALLSADCTEPVDVRVASAAPLCFLPASDGVRTGLLDGSNHIWSGTRSLTEWPADGASVVETEWRCGSRSIPVTYHASWIGVRLFDELFAQRFPGAPGVHRIAASYPGCPAWLYARTAVPGLLSEDARLLEITGRLRGAPTRLLVNFITAKGLAPWIWDASAGAALPIPARKYGANSLARVFEHVLRGSAEPVSAGIDFSAALRAHQALWAIHGQLVPDPIDAEAEYRRALELLATASTSSTGLD